MENGTCIEVKGCTNLESDGPDQPPKLVQLRLSKAGELEVNGQSLNMIKLKNQRARAVDTELNS